MHKPYKFRRISAEAKSSILRVCGFFKFDADDIIPNIKGRARFHRITIASGRIMPKTTVVMHQDGKRGQRFSFAIWYQWMIEFSWKLRSERIA
ncbi:hypothetical protein TALK_14830 [Thalassospira alkalitolerans]|uniref:Uncharacterized protein n=1 Tax=Thalassospira alkalitolerans TaxID=1293890 RepID=A0A1Y2L9N0_9PROT|nr:hypothetical protein TALK_14830 [Thalassospira alkalitolerans]